MPRRTNLVRAPHRRTACSHTARAASACSGFRGPLQLLHFRQLTGSHLLHHVQDRLLFDFANLYKLHDGRVAAPAERVIPHWSQAAYNISCIPRGALPWEPVRNVRIRDSEYAASHIDHVHTSVHEVNPVIGQGNSSSRLRIVALTGFMGAGKTTVGRVLANALGWQFMDLDEEIENRHRQGVRDIFRLHGEAHIRQVETLALRDCLDGIPLSTVIALGGGTFIQPRNVELLRLASVHVVFLEASAEELFDRCRNTVSPEENLRPLAADPDAFLPYTNSACLCTAPPI